jgi:hypothetical protein
VDQHDWGLPALAAGRYVPSTDGETASTALAGSIGRASCGSSARKASFAEKGGCNGLGLVKVGALGGFLLENGRGGAM